MSAWNIRVMGKYCIQLGKTSRAHNSNKFTFKYNTLKFFEYTIGLKHNCYLHQYQVFLRQPFYFVKSKQNVNQVCNKKFFFYEKITSYKACASLLTSAGSKPWFSARPPDANDLNTRPRSLPSSFLITSDKSLLMTFESRNYFNKNRKYLKKIRDSWILLRLYAAANSLTSLASFEHIISITFLSLVPNKSKRDSNQNIPAVNY